MPLPVSDGIFKKFNLNLLSRNTPAQNYGYITVISETAFYHIHNIIIVTFFQKFVKGLDRIFSEKQKIYAVCFRVKYRWFCYAYKIHRESL